MLCRGVGGISRKQKGGGIYCVYRAESKVTGGYQIVKQDMKKKSVLGNASVSGWGKCADAVTLPTPGNVAIQREKKKKGMVKLRVCVRKVHAFWSTST